MLFGEAEIALIRLIGTGTTKAEPLLDRFNELATACEAAKIGAKGKLFRFLATPVYDVPERPARCTIKFRQQGELWLESLANRKRNPVEQTTIDNRRYALDKWIYPTVGDHSSRM